MRHFSAVGFSLVQHSPCEPPKKGKYYKKHREKKITAAATFTSLTKTSRSALPLTVLPTSAVSLLGLWALAYGCLSHLYIYIYIEIYFYIYIYSFSSRFTGRGIFHSSQAPVCWSFFCRSREEGEPLNHQGALTMQTRLCRTAFKKHFTFYGLI